MELSNNQEKWDRKEKVSLYTNEALQIPEILIFIKHKNCFYEKKILDIGCGAGRTTIYLSKLANKYTGIDYSSVMIEYCKEMFEDTQFECLDAREMSVFKDNSFDFVLFSYNGIDYVAHEDRIRILREINRVLKKDHILVFSSHNKEYKNIGLKPNMPVSKNPCKQLTIVRNYLESLVNHQKLKSKQYFGEDYSIINDVEGNYSLLTYYIDKKAQKIQLEENGFELLEMYDTSGNRIDDTNTVKESPWIYYVAKKVNCISESEKNTNSTTY